VQNGLNSWPITCHAHLGPTQHNTTVFIILARPSWQTSIGLATHSVTASPYLSRDNAKTLQRGGLHTYGVDSRKISCRYISQNFAEKIWLAEIWDEFFSASRKCKNNSAVRSVPFVRSRCNLELSEVRDFYMTLNWLNVAEKLVNRPESPTSYRVPKNPLI